MPAVRNPQPLVTNPQLVSQFVVSQQSAVPLVRSSQLDAILLEGFVMPIEFRHDVDAVLKYAKHEQKPLLLDFSAAPM